MKLFLCITLSIAVFTVDCHNFPDGLDEAQRLKKIYDGTQERDSPDGPNFAPYGPERPIFIHDGFKRPNFAPDEPEGLDFAADRPKGPEFALNGPEGTDFAHNGPKGYVFDPDGPQGPYFASERSEGPEFASNGHDGADFADEDHQQLKMEEGQTESEVREATGCPTEDGFFSPPCTNKCFKFFNSKWRNYTEAMDICHENGMKLPHPYNAVSLRSYLLQRFGLAYYWMDARGIGKHFRWQNGIDIINSNPLWLHDPSGRTDSNYCMVMLAHSYYWNISLTAPYVSWSCSKYLATMCELKLE